MRDPVAERREKVASWIERFAWLPAGVYGDLKARSEHLADDIEALYSGASFQDRVRPWMLECFGPVIPFDKVERGDRLLEEVFELLQSGGYDPARVLALRDYVWARPVGEPEQEAGGVMVTIAAYCLAFGLDMRAAGERELARIWTKVETIRAKQATKPTGSALPIADFDGIGGSGRRDIASAPRDTTLIVETRSGLLFKAFLGTWVEGPDGGVLAWTATHEDLHPPCWTDGICWASNEDGAPSDPPVRWMPLPPSPMQPLSGGVKP